MEEDDVRNNLRPRIGAEGVVRKAYSAQQLAALCKIAPHALVLCVHRVARGDERDNAARTHLVEHLGGEVVVNREAKAVVLRVKDLVVAKWHIAHCEVIEAGAAGSLEASNGDLSLGVELLCNAPSDAVQLHAVQLAAAHRIWQQAEEVADAHGRLEYAPTFKAQIDERIIDGANNCRRGVVRVERGTAHGLVFLGRERGFHLCVFLCPVSLVFVKGVRYSAPAGVAGKRLLLVSCSRTPLGLDALDRRDCVHVRTEPCLGSTLAELIVHDAEVARRGRRRFRFRCGAYGLENNVVRQMIGLGVIVRDGMFTEFVVCLIHILRLFNGYARLLLKHFRVVSVHPTHSLGELLPRHKTGGHYVSSIVGYPVVQSVLFRALASG